MRHAFPTRAARTTGGPEYCAPEEYEWITTCDACERTDRETDFDNDDTCRDCAEREALLNAAFPDSPTPFMEDGQ